MHVVVERGGKHTRAIVYKGKKIDNIMIGDFPDVADAVEEFYGQIPVVGMKSKKIYTTETLCYHELLEMSIKV